MVLALEDKKLFAGIMIGSFLGILGGIIVNSFFFIIQLTNAFSLFNILLLYVDAIFGLFCFILWINNL